MSRFIYAQIDQNIENIFSVDMYAGALAFGSVGGQRTAAGVSPRELPSLFSHSFRAH